MNKEQMRGLFKPGQGVKLICDCDPGAEVYQGVIRASDPEAAITGMALLAIRLAMEMEVPAENVLAATAVAIMNIGRKMPEKELEE